MSKHKKHKNPNQNININDVSTNITMEEEIDDLGDEMENETDKITDEESDVIEETISNLTDEEPKIKSEKTEETKSIEVSEIPVVNNDMTDLTPVEPKIKSEETVEVTESYYTVATSVSLGKFINKCGNFVTRDQAINRANSATIETGVIHNVYDPTGKIIFTAKTKLTLFSKKKRGVNYVNRNVK